MTYSAARRRHSTLGFRSPADFEADHLAATLAAQRNCPLERVNTTGVDLELAAFRSELAAGETLAASEELAAARALARLAGYATEGMQLLLAGGVHEAITAAGAAQLNV